MTDNTPELNTPEEVAEYYRKQAEAVQQAGLEAQAATQTVTAVPVDPQPVVEEPAPTTDGSEIVRTVDATTSQVTDTPQEPTGAPEELQGQDTPPAEDVASQEPAGEPTGVSEEDNLKDLSTGPKVEDFPTESALPTEPVNEDIVTDASAPTEETLNEVIPTEADAAQE